MRVVLALLLALCASPLEAATVYVCDTGGDDTRSYATAQSVLTPWDTIGRAAWGSTNRAAPNGATAAQTGDTVVICGGTYDFSGVISDRWGVAYNPANAGVTFQAAATVTLTAASTASPVIGCDARDDVVWTGPFLLNENSILIAADTGPAVLHDASGCQIIGVTLIGITQAFNDNHNGIRVEVCDNCLIRNVTFTGFRKTPNNHNGSCITLYGTTNSLIENIDCRDSEGGIFWKDTGTYTQGSNIVRYNYFEGVGQMFVMSLVGPGSTETGSTHYQNVGVDVGACVNTIGDPDAGPTGDRFYNNTCIRPSSAGFYITDSRNTTGIEWHNNIVYDPAIGILIQASQTMPAASVISSQRNSWFSAATFYDSASDGTRTFASYQLQYTDQDVASVTTDPLMVDAAGGDFRLCTGAGVPSAGCSGASPVLTLGLDTLDLDGDGSTVDSIPAGAYITGNETIGLTSEAVGVGAGGRWRMRRGDH